MNSGLQLSELKSVPRQRSRQASDRWPLHQRPLRANMISSIFPISIIMQPSLRRKFSPALLSAAASFTMKPAAFAARKGGNLSIFVVILTIFLFGCFMYNEDVKSLAEFPFSHPKDQEIALADLAKQRSVNVDTKITTVSVVMNARTVMETEVEGGGDVSDGGVEVKSGREKVAEEKRDNNDRGHLH